MNRDNEGLERLRNAIDDVAANLPPARTRRPEPAPTWRLTQAAVVLSVLVFAVVFWVAVRINAPHGAEVAGVQVVLLKVDGREAAARVIDARAAGTVLVMPQEETR